MIAELRRRILRIPPIRFLSSIPFGVTILTLVLVYASIGSALPQVRGVIEMTEMEYFHHWVFAVLIILFCVSLTLATLLRVRWRLEQVGVLIVHSGLLVLTGGAFWYFYGKIEGDVFLASPHLQIVSSGNGQSRAVEKVLAYPGERWETTAPALGGRIAVEVLESSSDRVQPAQRVEARLTVGEEQRVVTLDQNDSMAELTGPLSVRLVDGIVRDAFYDDNQPVLYARTAEVADWIEIPINGLPGFRERYEPVNDVVLTDAADNPVPSHRNDPALPLGGFSIPTGWFEMWRMPIPLPSDGLPVTVTVDGFVPYVAGFQQRAAAGGTETVNPAVNIAITNPARSSRRSLFAFDPRQSVTRPFSDMLPIEFRWVTDETEAARLLQPLAGPHELHVRTLDPPTEHVFAVTPGQEIQVPGTDYQLTIKELTQQWPLMTPGFEDALTPMAAVQVERGDVVFDRTVLQRFPNLSQDVDDQGAQRTAALVDPNIQLRYRSSATGRVLIVGRPGPDGDPALQVGVFGPNGRVFVHDAPPGKPIRILEGARPINLRVDAVFRSAAVALEPVIQPINRRRPNVAHRSMSAIRLHLVGKGALAGWEARRWVPFSSYQEIDSQPVTVHLPDEHGPITFLYSRQKHALPATIALRRLETVMFPGEMQATAWRSELLYQPHDGGEVREAEVFTNETYTIGGWTLFQSGADNERRWEWSILGVGNRHGMSPMVYGSVLITIGLLYAFYVKPVIQRRRAGQRGQAVAASRSPGEPQTPSAPEKADEPAEPVHV